MLKIGRKRGNDDGSDSDARAAKRMREREGDLVAAPTLDGLFTEFASYLRWSGDNTVKKALELMFPNSMSESSRSPFETLLLSHCLQGLQLVKTATMTPEGPEAEQLAGKPDGTYDKQHAMKIKYYIGMLFSKENETFKEGQTIIDFHTLNQPFFYGLNRAEEQFSEDVAAAAAAAAAAADVDISATATGTALQNIDFMAVAELPSQPQESWSSITIGDTTLPYIQVDASTLEFILKYSRYISRGQLQLVYQSLKTGAYVARDCIIQIGMSTIKVSIYTLLWLTKFIYDLATNGRFGSILNRVVEIMYANKEFLFGGPFLNISNPTIDESTRRRLNRIVFTFFYTMVDLLIFIKGNELITRDLPLTQDLNQGLSDFIAKESSTWTLQEIFEYGSELYVAVMGGRGTTPGMGYLHEYYVLYDKSIGIVTGLLDNRIFDAKIKSLNAILTPLAIVIQADQIHTADPAQIKEVQSAIAKLQDLGAFPDELQKSLTDRGWVQDPDGAAAGTAAAQVAVAPAHLGAPADMDTADDPDGDRQELGGGGRIKRRRKTTKRRRKSTRRIKSKRRSYKKTSKSKKGRKYKRRSMREVKDKLIHLINSL